MARAYLGGRAAVLLTLAAAALSIATGIANIGTPPSNFGPVAPFVPDWARLAAGFTGTLTGFLLLAGAVALRSGLRAGWYAVAVLLPVTAAQGLVQSSGLSIPLVALSLVSLLVVVRNRRRFRRRVDVTPTQTAAALLLVGSQLYISVGAFALREEFGGVNTVTDAVYFALVTSSTVGYGDITPQSEMARIFGLTALLLGTVSFAVGLGALLQPLFENVLTTALGRMKESDLDLLDDHVLVLGYGELTEPLLQELGEASHLVVTEDETHERELREHDRTVFFGDPSDEETLTRVHVRDARAAIIATNDDASDALAILTARQLNPDLWIVAAATQRENVAKLKRAGANEVISPATIGGRLLVQSALGRTDAESAARDFLGEPGGGEDPGGPTA